MLDPEWVRITLLTAAPLLFSLTVHEYAHARVALAFGDPTAKHNGRVTLNPLKHLDPIGTLMLLFSGIMGWAKPVPVNPLNLHPIRLGQVMVSLAGPLTNLSLGIICGLGLRAWTAWAPADHAAYATVRTLLYYTAIANLGLCFFNLIPLFPLDGHHVARELLPVRQQDGFMRWQLRFGGLILMAMIFVPHILGPRAPDLIGIYFNHVIRPLLGVLLYWTPSPPGG